MINGLPPTSGAWTGLETPTSTRPAKGAGATGGPEAQDFGNTLEGAVKAVEGHQAASDDKLYRVASGADQDYAGMMISLEQANISLRAMGSVRDKVIEAYQAVWNMPV